MVTYAVMKLITMMFVLHTQAPRVHCIRSKWIVDSLGRQHSNDCNHTKTAYVRMVRRKKTGADFTSPKKRYIFVYVCFYFMYVSIYIHDIFIYIHVHTLMRLRRMVLRVEIDR